MNKQSKGHIVWNKGLTREIDKRVAQYGDKHIGKHHSEETKRKIGIMNKGHTHTLKTKLKMSKSRKGKQTWAKGKHWFNNFDYGMKGKHHSLESKKKMYESSRKAEKSNLWRGGVTSIIGLLRKSYKYRQWRSDIFTRDNFICQRCNKKGGILNAHHIEAFNKIVKENNIKYIEEALNCEELWNINNGITLCLECHIKTDNYLKHNNYAKKQLKSSNRG